MNRFFAGDAHEHSFQNSRLARLTRRASAAALCASGVIICLPHFQHDMSMEHPPIGYDISRPAAFSTAVLAGALYAASRLMEHSATRHTESPPAEGATEISQLPEDSEQK
jgi:hypothetical protein